MLSAMGGINLTAAIVSVVYLFQNNPVLYPKKKKSKPDSEHNYNKILHTIKMTINRLLFRTARKGDEAYKAESSSATSNQQATTDTENILRPPNGLGATCKGLQSNDDTEIANKVEDLSELENTDGMGAINELENANKELENANTAEAISEPENVSVTEAISGMKLKSVQSWNQNSHVQVFIVNCQDSIYTGFISSFKSVLHVKSWACVEPKVL